MIVHIRTDIRLRGWIVLADAGTDGDGCLEAPEIRRSMDDDPALSLGRLDRLRLRRGTSTGVRRHIRGTGFRSRGMVLVVLRVDHADDARPQGTRLHPTAIRERRIVGGGRGEMPVLVGSIEARAVSIVVSGILTEKRQQEQMQGRREEDTWQ